MPCIMGPIPPTATSGYVQVQLEDYGTKNNPGVSFVLDKNGTCWVDLPKLMAFAGPPTMTADQADTGTDIARSVLAALGHPITGQPSDERR